MRVLVLLLLLGSSAVAQGPEMGRAHRQNCVCSSADVLYRPVIHEMWSQDEGENRYAGANGFIRIAVHPAWSPEYFVDVRLNRKGAATVTVYSLPKATKSLTVLLKKELSQHPNADVKSLTKILPVKRRSLEADKKIEDLVSAFFALKWEPRRIPDLVRLDATEYELEFVGDDTLLFDSDDHETPMVRWIESFLSAVYEASPR